MYPPFSFMKRENNVDVRETFWGGWGQRILIISRNAQNLVLLTLCLGNIPVDAQGPIYFIGAQSVIGCIQGKHLNFLSRL